MTFGYGTRRGVLFFYLKTGRREYPMTGFPMRFFYVLMKKGLWKGADYMRISWERENERENGREISAALWSRRNVFAERPGGGYAVIPACMEEIRNGSEKIWFYAGAVAGG